MNTEAALERDHSGLGENPGVDTRLPGSDPRRRLLHGYLHKTSNSLCGIKGYASLIASGQKPHPLVSSFAQKILAEVEKMEEIYHSVQDMAFPALGEAAGSDLQTTIDGAVAASRQRFPNLRITCGVIPASAMLLPARDLQMAIVELLANSAESRHEAAGPQPVTVALNTVTNGDGRLELTIRDDGPGLEAEMRAQAGIPFVTTKNGHLGIGLARIDTIMDMYGLAWRLDSRPGQGTNVVLEVAQLMATDGGTREIRREG